MRTGQRLETEIRRQEIIGEARQILAAHGMDALTVKTLARASGITEGAVYRHFRSKREILLGLVDELEEVLFETLDRAKDTTGSPLEKLERVFRAHLSHVERRRGVTFIVISEVLRGGDRLLRQRMQGVVDRYLALVEGLVVEGVQAGEVSPQINPSAAAMAFFGVVQGAVTLWRFDNEALPLAERGEALWQVYRGGIMPRQVPQPES